MLFDRSIDVVEPPRSATPPPQTSDDFRVEFHGTCLALHCSLPDTNVKRFTDPKGVGMWIFDERVAHHRKSINLVVRIASHSDPDVSGRREGLVLSDDAPLVHPFPKTVPAEVKVKYTNRRKKDITETMAVSTLLTSSRCKQGGMHLIINGDRMGELVIHVKTESGLAKVYLVGASRSDVFYVDVQDLCIVEPLM